MFCDFDESIEFLNSVKCIKGEIETQIIRSIFKSLAIPLEEWN